MRVYRFKPKDGIWITRDLAEELLSFSRLGVGKALVSLDLGLTETVVEVDTGVIRVSGMNVELDLKRIVNAVKRPDLIYFLDVKNGSLKPVVMTSPKGDYYKLRNVGKDRAPTLEINGIHMHNILNTDPWKDSSRKVTIARVKGGKVLDICTGLGYTAIGSYIRGADVVTIEKDPYVLKIAELNPWSRKLSNIKILLGDAVHIVSKLRDNYFNTAIHDPPRFSLAGELYSKDFYQTVFDKLEEGGYMFHYTGGPGKHRGISFQKGVVNRLRYAGFEIIRVYKDYGVLARKPRL